jgi:oligoribonuclease NrnB/cAMP/cGMP phosphodiesterase (DHH superfamily)
MNKKILHISHVKDLDGKICPMMTRLLLSGDYMVVTTLLDNDQMDTCIVSELSASYYDYDLIIITDLGVSEDTFDFLADLVHSKNAPIHFFDHHINSVENAAKYSGESWIHVDTTISAALIYCRFLYDDSKEVKWSSYSYQSKIDTGLRLSNVAVNVSDYDTFAFKDNGNTEAERLNILLGICGDDLFEEGFRKYVSGCSNEIGREEDLAIVNYILKDRQRYIDRYQNLDIVKILGRRCVVVFTDRPEYVSELGYQICKCHADVDLLVAVNFRDKAVQIRSRKESAKLYDFAKHFGGGGHKFSGGFPLTIDIYKIYLMHAVSLLIHLVRQFILENFSRYKLLSVAKQ